MRVIIIFLFICIPIGFIIVFLLSPSWKPIMDKLFGIVFGLLLAYGIRVIKQFWKVCK